VSKESAQPQEGPTQRPEEPTQRTQRPVKADAETIETDTEDAEGLRGSAGRFCVANWELISRS